MKKTVLTWHTEKTPNSTGDCEISSEYGFEKENLYRNKKANKRVISKKSWRINYDDESNESNLYS